MQRCTCFRSYKLAMGYWFSCQKKILKESIHTITRH